MTDILTYLTHLRSEPAQAPPRVGDRVLLRPARGAAGTETVAWSECGRRLGRLPPAERGMLDDLGFGHPLTARVAAVLPRPGVPQAERLLLRVEAA